MTELTSLMLRPECTYACPGIQGPHGPQHPGMPPPGGLAGFSGMPGPPIIGKIGRHSDGSSHAVHHNVKESTLWLVHIIAGCPTGALQMHAGNATGTWTYTSIVPFSAMSSLAAMLHMDHVMCPSVQQYGGCVLVVTMYMMTGCAKL